MTIIIRERNELWKALSGEKVTWECGLGSKTSKRGEQGEKFLEVEDSLSLGGGNREAGLERGG